MNPFLCEVFAENVIISAFIIALIPFPFTLRPPDCYFSNQCLWNYNLLCAVHDQHGLPWPPFCCDHPGWHNYLLYIKQQVNPSRFLPLLESIKLHHWLIHCVPIKNVNAFVIKGDTIQSDGQEFRLFIIRLVIIGCHNIVTMKVRANCALFPSTRLSEIPKSVLSSFVLSHKIWLHRALQCRLEKFTITDWCGSPEYNRGL